MSQVTLTSLATVKSWLNVDTSTDDTLLTRLIAQASRFVLGYIKHPDIFKRTYSEIYSGTGSQRLFLRNWPVLGVTSLSIGTLSVPAAENYWDAGYRLEPWDGLLPGRKQAIDLCGYQTWGGSGGTFAGYQFWAGPGNISVTYTAGYAVVDEAQTVPATPYQVTVDAPYGNFAVDEGVTYANGTDLTKVSSSPAAGEYSVNSSGAYTFSAADTGESVLISYSFVPDDLEQACIELVAERYKYRERIGQTSKSLGGQETVAFSQKDLPDYVKTLLQPYINQITPAPCSVVRS